MYHRFKKIFLRLIPVDVWLKAEYVIRAFLYWCFYRGTKHVCNLCQANLRSFVVQDFSKDLLCPRCGSLSRTRVLWHYLEHQVGIYSCQKILDFTPHRYMKKLLKRNMQERYVDTDYLSKRYTQQYDICQINTPAQEFDLIICYHILEHVKKDVLAMQELYRVISPKGQVLLQVPLYEQFKEEPLNQEFTPDVRIKLFDQEDHVRCYTEKILLERLESVGFKVDKLYYASSLDIHRMGFQNQDVIFKCTKPNT